MDGVLVYRNNSHIWSVFQTSAIIIIDMQIQIKKLHPAATIPIFAHATDAGMDLCTTEAVTIEPGASAAVSTGLAFAIPEGYVGLIWDKSGVAIKRNIKTKAGVIDAGYRGEVFIGVFNIGTETQTFNVGDKVAQMLIQKIEQPTFVEVTELDETPRGTGGFGSTGT